LWQRVYIGFGSMAVPMTTACRTSRTFHQNKIRARTAAAASPVFIADRGEPGHGLRSIAEYRRIIGQRKNVAGMLSVPPGAGDIDFSQYLAGPECAAGTALCTEDSETSEIAEN
jgi:hypothetical protein